MTGEIRPSNTETISPTGLSWENIGINYWILRRNGYYACTLTYTPMGYYANVSGVINTRYSTLAEAQAVAIALVSMRDK